MALKLSSRRVKIEGLPNAELWEGLLRDEKNKIVWTCGHQHAWRSGSSSYGTSAISCAWYEKQQREVKPHDE